MGYQEVISQVGDATGTVSQKIIKGISNAGLDIGATQSKAISLVVILVLIYFVIKIIIIPKKSIKLAIIGILIFLGVSITFSLFS